LSQKDKNTPSIQAMRRVGDAVLPTGNIKIRAKQHRLMRLLLVPAYQTTL